MAIKTTCPNCQTSFNLADTMEGKKVRCKSCQQAFTVSVGGQARAEMKAGATDNEDVQDKVQSPARGAPPVPRNSHGDDGEDERASRKATPPRRSWSDDDDDEDDDDVRPSRNSRTRRDEDDDDEDDRASRRRRRQGGGNGMVWLWLGIGGAVAAGVIVVLVILLTGGGPAEDPEIAEIRRVLGPEAAEMALRARELQKNFGNVAAKEFGNALKNFPKDNPFPPNNNLTLADHLRNLKTGGDQEKRQAVDFFGRTSPEVPQRAEVARALDTLFGSNIPGIEMTLIKWATKEQGPTLVKMAANPAFTVWDNERRCGALKALGRVKDERGIDVMAEKLGNIFDRDSAREGFRSFGKEAQTGLVRNMFHKNGESRGEVQTLLKELGTPPDVMVAQAAKDLGNADQEIQNAAADWLVKAPPVERLQAQVAAALERLTNFPETRNNAVRALENWATKENVPALAKLLAQDGTPHAEIMKALARLKDERGAEAVAARLSNFFEREAAVKALQSMGAAAEKALLGCFNHPDQGVRDTARKLLKGLNADGGALLDLSIKDLAGQDNNKRNVALTFLSQAPVVDDKRAEVTKAVTGLLNDPDRSVQENAFKAFLNWAGKENVGTLIQLVVAEQSPHRGQVIDALARLKDETGAAAIASRLTNFFDRGHASKALKSMGPVAEKAVVQALGAKDAAVRIEACHILREIGTREISIPALNRVVALDPKNKGLFNAAGAAAQAIQAR